MDRRGLLKAGTAIIASTALVMTLEPREARATGSWGGPRTEGNEDPPLDEHQSFIIPGTYQWRLRREAMEQQRRRELGAFDRFAHAED